MSSKSGIVIRRETLVWLLVCQVLVLLPFAGSHPWWLLVLLVACVAWRIRTMQRGEAMIRPWVKYVVLVLGLLGLYASGYRQYDVDTMIALVLFGFSIKILETSHRRDTAMLVLTGYFLCAAQFIYSQTPWQALYSLCVVTVLSACAVSIYSGARYGLSKSSVEPLKVAASMMALSAPLAVLLFFIVPRIPPMWSIPQKSQATTGISDEITPGDIASLVKSPKEAFRVSFLGAIPPREDWYWRALVFQNYDGKTWRQGSELPPVSIPQRFVDQSDYRYQIVMEASGQRWVPSLDTPTVFNKRKASFRRNRTLKARRAINAVSGFEIASNTQLSEHYALDIQERLLALQLPKSGNQRLRRWAQEQRASVQSDSEFVQRVLRYIRDNDYFYTLRPPRLLSEASQDEFWFDSRQGFCSHYASAFVFIARSVGIPARLVGGYQGGRYNAQERFITVRQMDAHAWAEVWLQGEGWVRIDPTAAVAPQRVRQDLSELFADSPDMVSELAGRTSSFTALKRMQLWLDVFEYQWQRWVVQFDEDTRMGLFNRLFDNRNLLERIGLLTAVLAVVPILWLVLLGRSRGDKSSSQAVRCLIKLEKKLARNGVCRSPDEPVARYIARAKVAMPEYSDQLDVVAKGFYQLEYARLLPEQYRYVNARLRKAIASF